MSTRHPQPTDSTPTASSTRSATRPPAQADSTTRSQSTTASDPSTTEIEPPSGAPATFSATHTDRLRNLIDEWNTAFADAHTDRD
ncbi:hypothetical protein [Natrialba asiatica]|uniref:Uncharacterized protein n=1 Tax=Natrialba asiatica (strain ATCC 700177 / DSM 12278 / JCM 9576 / FERM P-10747 / NBRC 102637 / 172P1) TaxID=29540 RepID=M0B133_NATA1|nr:hypothetical protein [Natrialba asiatica]ELZ03404.1 hypothetical protein C481_05395 [Natrialba asiatica DSM 12278]